MMNDAILGSSVEFTGNNIVALVVAIGGIITGILTTRRGQKSDKASQEHDEFASLMKGYLDQIGNYATIVTSLQSEIARLHEQRLEDQREQQSERKLWNQEKMQLTKANEDLRSQLSKVQKELEALKNR